MRNQTLTSRLGDRIRPPLGFITHKINACLCAGLSLVTGGKWVFSSAHWYWHPTHPKRLMPRDNLFLCWLQIVEGISITD